MPLPTDGYALEGEIQRVLEGGTFLDMRHMLDASTVRRGVIGVIYVEDFTVDADLVPGRASA